MTIMNFSYKNKAWKNILDLLKFSRNQFRKILNFRGIKMYTLNFRRIIFVKSKVSSNQTVKSEFSWNLFRKIGIFE